MTSRYDQLIADLRAERRPQREWGEGRGVLMVVGHFLVGVAGGTWVLGSIFGDTTALTVGWVLGVLGGVAHLLFLGRPERALNMVQHVRTSWISRGFVGLSMLLVGGALVLGPVVAGVDGELLGKVGKLMAAIGALVVIGYMGFCYTASKGVPFWHSPLHPAIYIGYAFRGGIAVLLVLAAARGVGAAGTLLQMWLGCTLIVALFVGLEMHGALTGESIAARWSARDVLAGRLSTLFYGGTLALGVIVPLALLATAWTGSAAVIALVGLASVAGDFFMKLSAVKAGVYRPLRVPARGPL
jgi:formate-dependent nitrite reductase membrane component NrfD